MDLNDQEFDSEFNDDEKYSDNHLNDQDDNQAEDKDSDEALNGTVLIEFRNQRQSYQPNKQSVWFPHPR